MADTERTKAALATLFADNVTGQISPQDLRDFLESMHPSFGGCYVSTSLVTTCTDAGTFYVAGADSGATTASNLHRFTHTSPGRLTYTGTPTRHFHIAVSVSFQTSGTNDVIAIRLAKGGTTIAGSALRRFVGTASQVGSTALHWDGELATNEYLELYVANETAGGTTVTISAGYMFALGMMM